jgi:hypothetical protein
MLFWSWEAWHILPNYEQKLNLLTITYFYHPHNITVRVLMCKYIEYPYSLNLLVLRVREVSDTGTQIHLSVY